MLHEEFLVIRQIAKLLGKFTSSFSAVRFGPLHCRSLERDKVLALKFRQKAEGFTGWENGHFMVDK